MDQRRFDALARSLAVRSRRDAVRLLIGGAAGGLLGLRPRARSAGRPACGLAGDPCEAGDGSCCGGLSCLGGRCCAAGRTCGAACCGPCDDCDSKAGTCLPRSCAGACEACDPKTGACASECASCQVCEDGQCRDCRPEQCEVCDPKDGRCHKLCDAERCEVCDPASGQCTSACHPRCQYCREGACHEVCPPGCCFACDLDSGCKFLCDYETELCVDDGEGGGRCETQPPGGRTGMRRDRYCLPESRLPEPPRPCLEPPCA